jgi:hypothetical protein
MAWFRGEQLCEVELPGRMLVWPQGSATVKRTYSVGVRAFEIMCVPPAKNHLPWTIEHVIETSRRGAKVVRRSVAASAATDTNEHA